MNTNLRHEGRLLHVQTEDLGERPTRFQTLVYFEGRILRSIDKVYEELAAANDAVVRKKLAVQHRTVMRAVLRKRLTLPLDPVEPASSPALVITPLEQLKVSTRAALLILLHDQRTFAPVADGPLRITCCEGDRPGIPVYEGTTDSKGFHIAEFAIPAAAGIDIQIVVETGGGELLASASLPVAPAVEAWAQSKESSDQESIDLVVSDLKPIWAGHSAELMILVRGSRSCRPMSNVDVKLMFSAGLDEQRLIGCGVTDERGFLLTDPVIPLAEEGGAMLTVVATLQQETTEVALPVFLPAR